MKLIRRAHLYSGLALVPFVVLYGITGLLFNHPTLWSESEVQTIPAATLTKLGRENLVPPERLAAEVLTELGDPDWQFDSTVAPTYQGRSFWSGNTPDKRLSLVIDQVNGDARVFERPRTDRPETTDRELATDLSAGQDSLATIATATSAFLTTGSEQSELSNYAAGAAGVQWRVRSQPRLRFGVIDADGEPHRAVYDLRKRALEVTPETEPQPRRTLRSFLLRLHTAHGYPAHHGASFWWALVVDAMAIAMTTWALSGILMWWQMKNLRRLGLLTLLACAIGTTLLVAGQWQLLR